MNVQASPVAIADNEFLWLENFVRLGDGNLRYGRENIMESYYTMHVWRGIFLSVDVQRIWNPGYNRDRGPVLIPGFRVHLEL